LQSNRRRRKTAQPRQIVTTQQKTLDNGPVNG
jgi:hypothetical protein